VAGDGEFIDSVFFLGASADVVDDEGSTGGVLFVAYDHDVGEVWRDGAGDDVSG